MFSPQFACPRSMTGGASGVIAAARLGVIGLALLAGGCAASETTSPSWVAGPLQALVQAEPVPPPKAANGVRVDIEEDGLPSQLAPRERRTVADDPTEPWSPNYGSAAPRTPAAPVAPITEKRRTAAKDDVAATAATPVSYAPAAAPLSADDVIRQAIAAHEMNRRD